jgi:hypothetical protein
LDFGALQSHDQFAPAQDLVFPLQDSEPCLHGSRIGAEQLLRDLRIDLMIVGIIRKMEFERAIWIDANIWKGCKRASGAALMQSHFPPRQAVNRRLGLVIRDIAANILYDTTGAGIGGG